MKRVIIASEYVEAMAVINPKMSKQLTIRAEVVQGGEGEIPHIHVYHSPARNPRECSYIRLDKPEYSPHHKGFKNKPLTKKQFIELMTALWDKEIPGVGHISMTGYEGAVNIWVDTYEDDYSKFTIDTEGHIVMPDYTQLATSK